MNEPTPEGMPDDIRTLLRLLAHSNDPAVSARAAEGLRIPDIPPGLLGPTGKVFFNPDGSYSTHVNMLVEQPGGGFALNPLLVPGQTGMAGLAAGGVPTLEQRRLAIDYADRNMGGGIPVEGSTPEEALAAERLWHRLTELRMRPYSPGPEYRKHTGRPGSIGSVFGLPDR